MLLPPAEPNKPTQQEEQPEKPKQTENLTMQEMFRIMMKKMDENSKELKEGLSKQLENVNKKLDDMTKNYCQKMDDNCEKFCQQIDDIRNDNKLWMEEVRNDNKRWREELRNERTKEIKNDNKLETEEIPINKTRKQIALLSGTKHDKNQENIKRREMKSKKMRRMHPKKLIKTREELEMMHSGLINVSNIPMTNDKDIMNFIDYRSRSKQISTIIYNKTVCYSFKRNIDKLNTTEIEIYGKTSVLSLIIDVPVTSWFNEPYNKMILIRFEQSERITEKKRNTREKREMSQGKK